MRHLLLKAALDGDFEVDSAGTADWHTGKGPDPRSVEAAADRGINLTGVARQVTPEDLDSFDLIVAMDRSNRDDLLEISPGASPRIRLLRDYADGTDLDVPDPYHGDSGGFAEVLDIVLRNCAALLASEQDLLTK